MNLWHKLTGVKVHPAFCSRCGVDVKPWKTRSIIYKFHCQSCSLKAVVTFDQVPDKCPGCQARTSLWRYEGPVSKTEKVPGEFCGPCRKVVEDYQREIKKGGVAWWCKDCHGSGVEKADSAFSKAVRQDYPKGGTVQVSRNAGCPCCGMLARMGN